MFREPDLSATQIEQLDDALVQLALGTSLSDVLAQAGADAAWLRPLLAAATQVKDLPPPHPLPAPEASLQRMLAHAKTLRDMPPVTARPTPATSPASPGLWARLMTMFAPAVRGGVHVAALAASILIAFLAGTLLGSGAIYAAQQSLPGDPGYGLKRAIEDVQLGLTFNPARREYLQAQFNNRRRFETELLLVQGRETEIVLEDNIQAVDDKSVVMGLAISLTDDTEIEGLLTPGARVRLEVIIAADGQATAMKIVVIQPGTPAASPTATPGVTASPTAAAPAQTGDTISLPPTPTPSPSPTPGFADPLDDSDNSNNDSGNTNDDDFDDSNDNGDDAPPNNDNSDDSSDDDSLNDNDDSNFADDGSNDNSGSDDDFNDNSGDDDFNDDGEEDFADDSSNDNGDDDLSDDDFADDEFEDDSGNDDSSGSDNSDDNADDDNSGSGSNDNSDDSGDNDNDDDDD